MLVGGSSQLTGRLPFDEPLAPFGFARREALKTHCRPVEPPSASARLDIVPVHDGDPVLWCALVRAWAKARGRPPETLDPQIVRWRVASHCGQVRVRWRRRHEGGQHAVFGHCAHRAVRLHPCLVLVLRERFGPPGRTGPTRSAQQAKQTPTSMFEYSLGATASYSLGVHNCPTHAMCENVLTAVQYHHAYQT